MLIAVGSANEPKINAVKRAVGAVYSGIEHTFVSHEESSRVNDHPIAPFESRKGALNRALASRIRFPGADLWVGIEGGMEKELVPGLDKNDPLNTHRIAEVWNEYGYVVVISADGRLAHGRSSGLLIPEHFVQVILSGGTLNDAIEKFHDIERIGDRGGATQLLTGGALNRVSVYVPGIIQALSQLKMKDYYTPPK